MKPRHGLDTAGKAVVLGLVVLIVLGAAYVLVPALSKGGSHSTTLAGATGPNPIADQKLGIYSLIESFPTMRLKVLVNDPIDGIETNETYSYSVLGQEAYESVQYTRVEFSTSGVANDVIGWFNATGYVGLLEVVGPPDHTYNGTGAHTLPYITTYTGDFGIIPAYTDNATLFSELTKTSSTITSVGSLQANVTSYVLSERNPDYRDLTMNVAAIQGTSLELMVYLFERLPDGATITYQVIGLTR